MIAFLPPSSFRRNPAPGCLAVALAVVMAAALFSGSLVAQDGDKPAYDFSAKPEIQKRLDAVRKEISELPPEDTSSRRGELEYLELICLSHLESVDFAESQQKDKAQAESAARAWTRFDAPPPYSVRFSDGIKDNLATLTERRKLQETQIAIITRALDTAENQLSQAQQTQRKAEDSARASKTPEARRTAENDVAAAVLSSRTFAEDIGRMKAHLSGFHSTLATTAANSELAELQIKTIEKDIIFTADILSEILADIEANRRRSMASLSESPILQRWWDEFFETEKNFWNLRFTTFQKSDPTIRKDARQEFDKIKSRIDDWAAIGQLRVQQEQLDDPKAETERLSEGVQEVSRLQRLIAFATAEIGGSETPESSFIDRITGAIGNLWNTELYLAEQNAFIDGQKVTTARAVTVGKVLRLALILLVGVIILRFLAARVRAGVTKKANLPPGTADLAARGTFGIGLALLFIYGLNAVHIPLTAFAFLGGALAIGVGFGMQTILKNFISGLILIFERPLKIGDLVEVDAINGHIQQIGLRASVIRHSDGIETLIPNSSLLENKVTNYTFSTTELRHTIIVGVAYGSPTRDVAKSLQAVANEHGLVLENPAPEVRFEDFGDNALIFHLLYWFDSAKTPRSTLASDLRFMIYNAFSEAGFTFAFPQRDIHFDPSTPLHVEVSSLPQIPRPGPGAGQ